MERDLRCLGHKPKVFLWCERQCAAVKSKVVCPRHKTAREVFYDAHDNVSHP